jgi:polar amino acid transport system permease protein
MHEPLLAAFDAPAFFEFLRPSSDLASALWRTVYVSVVAQLLGTVLGVLAALGGMSPFAPLRWISGLFIWFFRGTPVIVQIFFWFYGANILIGVEIFPREVDILGGTISGAVLAGITALAVNEGAYMSEIVRAGIGSVDEGQTEAALAVGMTRRQTMNRIVLPQAARVIVPGLGNQFNNMLKTSSLLTFTGVYELFQHAQINLSASFQPVEVYLAVACWYLLLTTLWQLVQVQIERRLGRSERSDEPESLGTKLFGLGGTRRHYA